ncbi:hypothetical protein ASB7_02150 [Helicobacter ailurogastricus]|nr:hypothetical protein ASB7_02150 [Helicobacter ailurogastricus]
MLRIQGIYNEQFVKHAKIINKQKDNPQMITKRPNTPINLGDTSFRRKEIASDYKILLQGLHELPLEWDIHNGSQELFYRYVLESGLIKPPEKDIAPAEQAKRARTYSNALVKIGFIDDKRVLTPAG